ncbi:hypothetical protein LIER_21048 [Lithospermum erythrorhizon]|uniref:Uncharacterized protein n=1 Tax=Lithospermum erythrorhizon TaxID=34254 RepID=A0AAV3QR81_LITER
MPFSDRLDGVALPSREHGHDTNDGRILKAKIEKLIKHGYLEEFVGHDRSRQQGRGYSPPRKRERGDRARDKQPTPPQDTRRIDTISGGIVGGGDSRNSRINYSRRALYITGGAINKNEPISFFDSELGGIELPHNDPIVIAPLIANFTVERMLVDTGSSADILLSHKWEGPYCVCHVLGPGTYELKEMNGKPVRWTWHASNLCKFYY